MIQSVWFVPVKKRLDRVYPVGTEHSTVAVVSVSFEEAQIRALEAGYDVIIKGLDIDKMIKK